MEASTSNGSDDVKTFRGRSLEELLPQIRAELGPDAIVLRRREGLGGGVGGFFQRPYGEAGGRAPNGAERPLEIRSDRATIEGLSSPAVQALFEQATPFAAALAAATAEPRPEASDTDSFTSSVDFQDFAGTVSPEAPQAPPPPPAGGGGGLYGPQPNARAFAESAPAPFAGEEHPFVADATVVPADEAEEEPMEPETDAPAESVAV